MPQASQTLSRFPQNMWNGWQHIAFKDGIHSDHFLLHNMDRLFHVELPKNYSPDPIQCSLHADIVYLGCNTPLWVTCNMVPMVSNSMFHLSASMVLPGVWNEVNHSRVTHTYIAFSFHGTSLVFTSYKWSIIKLERLSLLHGCQRQL